MRDFNISMVSDAFSTSTRTVDVLPISQAIKQGRWREEVARIRCYDLGHRTKRFKLSDCLKALEKRRVKAQ
jgi:hypothetical protein